MTTFTDNVRLQKPAFADRNWHDALNANADRLDRSAALGHLAVATTEEPSSSLRVRLTPGAYAGADGSLKTFAGSNSLVLPASSTIAIWLDSAGIPAFGAQFPTTSHCRLATVTTLAASVSSIVDERVQCATASPSGGFLPTAGGQLTGAVSVKNPTDSLPVLAVDPIARTLSFFGATPATQAATLAALIDATTGVAGATVANVGTTHSQVILNSNFASLVAAVNALVAAMKRHGLMNS
ncbi:hypothetical protein EP7_005229 [Isosphaeraceae bacterium EP7]